MAECIIPATAGNEGTKKRPMSKPPADSKPARRRRMGLAEGLADFARPNNGKDWSRLVLGIVAGIAMLLVGRVWGESMLASTTERALRNEVRMEAMETRFEDHVRTQAEANRTVLEQLTEIRRLLQDRQNGPSEN
jgi:hypothetical protein